jgi:hypothetical protein
MIEYPCIHVYAYVHVFRHAAWTYEYVCICNLRSQIMVRNRIQVCDCNAFANVVFVNQSLTGSPSNRVCNDDSAHEVTLAMLSGKAEKHYQNGACILRLAHRCFRLLVASAASMDL